MRIKEICEKLGLKERRQWRPRVYQGVAGDL